MIANNSRTRRTVKKESFMQGVLALMFSQVFIKLLGYVYRCYLTNRDCCLKKIFWTTFGNLQIFRTRSENLESGIFFNKTNKHQF